MIASKKSDALKRESGQWVAEREKANTHKQPDSQSGQATRFHRSKRQISDDIQTNYVSYCVHIILCLS